MTNAASAPRPILVPREIVNADSVFVVSWAVEDGGRVEAGGALCDIETSKAVVTVEAESAGYVRRRADVGAEVAVGGILGFLTEAPHSPLLEDATTGGSVAQASATGAAAGAPQISAKARRKMAELGVDEALFAGRAVVRESDVVEVAAKRKAATTAGDETDPRGPFRREALGPIQRRVARVMQQSVAAMPASYLERSVDLAPVRERARALGAEAKSVVTELDLLVSAVSRACVEFPHFNGFLTDEYELRLFADVNVGVAVDVEGDLFVVVVKQASSKEPTAIAKELRGLQYLAQRRRLSVEHLAGGTITVTSMLGRGVHRFQPIPYPQQAAIIGIADPEPGTTRAALCLVFDHRVANGAQAAGFLAACARGMLGES